MEHMSNTNTATVRIAIDLANDFHSAGLLIPANAVAAYRAAASEAGVEIKFLDNGTPESHAWQTDDDDARQTAYDAVWAILDVPHIDMDVVVAQVRDEMDDDGWLNPDRITAICDQHGVHHEESDLLLDWAQA